MNAGPGSAHALRAANERALLDAVRRAGAGSQADLARATGLSAAAVSNIVAGLVGRGLLERRSTVHRGRRVLAVSYVGDRDVFGGVDVGRSHLRVALGDAVGAVLAEEQRTLVPGHRPETTLATVATRLAVMADRLGFAGPLRAVGVGLPGPLHRSTAAVVNGAILPGWVGVPVARQLAAATEEVVVENDANLGALATRAETRATDLVYVKAGSGVGAGLVVGGALRTGATGLAGELGHLAIGDVTNAALCRCGRRGCLETFASIETMAQSLSTVLDRRVDPAAVIAMGASGDAVVRRVFDDAGEAIGRALGAACTLLDPGLVVVGGQLAQLGAPFLASIRAGFARSALPATVDGTTIELSPLGARAEVLGALQLARSRAYA